MASDKIKADESTTVELAPELPQLPQLPTIVLSEGVRQDLLVFGKGGDPITGARLELNRDTGVCTATHRDGRVSTFDVSLGA